ncbi:cytochrome P450 [Moraxella bovis]|uniref:6-deoxyerythronolide B hydroxylase n=1 Tax=Moraxella bovis TaxID=476 RepID=A0A378PQ91_MORBO|nr:cytochrome P450 [Moraxella bovis]STY90450.1 6-deoxyerythronolide B hydroxylase [Moraxella bovis]
MGWSDETKAPLNAWIEKNRKATLSENRDEIASVALEFDGHIKAILDDKRTKRPDDVTFELMNDVVMPPQGKRVMSDEELVSLIRSELSTMSSAVGIIFEFFIHYPDVLIHLKTNPQDIDNAVLEILRLHDPLITNRRRTTCPVTLHGIDIPKDAKITINWQSANRNPKAFHQADSFELHQS